MIVLQIAITLFFVANPIGNSPAFLALVKNFPFERQKRILFREAIFAFLLAIFFQFFGEIFLTALHIDKYTVSLCGGFMLLIVALKMIFPVPEVAIQAAVQEPMFVPIATPLISGPGLLTIIMVKSKELDNPFMITSAIVCAWIGITFVLATSPYLQRFLGRNGMLALEQLMGMIVTMIAFEMIVDGADLFAITLK